MGACASVSSSETAASASPPAPASASSELMAEIAKMNGQEGFDAVIICTSQVAQAKYWQTRLESTRGQACKKGALVLAVDEDWAGDGAGNGLGTVYAFQKACAAAKEKGADLEKMLAEGGSVGMYHTAGKGTRLAPLPGAENNNKPGVKVPSVVEVDGKKSGLTILEAVVQQTGVYAKLRPGRISVFWGDQVFVPSAGHNPSGSHHADILAQLGPMPSKEEWAAKGLEKYGLIAVNASGDGAQVEKVTYDDAMKLLAGLGDVKLVGPSLGSFSVSLEMMKCLMSEFATELAGHEAKMDSDPHFWMPLTLAKDAYAGVMVAKGEFDEPSAHAHWDRMQAMKAKLPAGMGVFGAVPVGTDGYWWDYGQLKLFMKNTSLALSDSAEGKAYRAFLKVPQASGSFFGGSAPAGSLNASLSLNSVVKGGSIKGSLLNGCTIGTCDVEDSILVNVTARSVKGKGVVLYNVVHDGDLVLEDGEVVTNVFVPGQEKLVMKSTTATDGGKVFKTKMDNGNPLSFQDVYKMGKTTDVNECYAAAESAHAALAAAL